LPRYLQNLCSQVLLPSPTWAAVVITRDWSATPSVQALPVAQRADPQRRKAAEKRTLINRGLGGQAGCAWPEWSEFPAGGSSQDLLVGRFPSRSNTELCQCGRTLQKNRRSYPGGNLTMVRSLRCWPDKSWIVCGAVRWQRRSRR